MLIRWGVCFFLIVALAFPSHANEQLKTSVLKSAKDMFDAMQKNEYAKVIDLTYAGVVKKMGGRDRAIERLEAVSKQLKSQGIEIKGTEIGEPGEFLAEGNNLFVVIPTTNDFKLPQGTARGKSYILGISGDSGKNWTFIEGAGLRDKIEQKTYLPKLPEKLVLPGNEKPEILPE